MIKKITALLLSICISVVFSTVAVSAETPTNTATEPKYLALTFDDGPNNSTCIDVLDVLKKYDVPATFFTIGSRCTESTGDALKRIVEQKCEIGIHGYDHVYEGGWTIEQINADLQKCSDKVYNLANVRPTLFRLPFLNMPPTDVAEQITYPLISGGGAADYDGSSVETRVTGLLNAARDGQIFLCHCFEGNTNTVNAIDQAIPQLIEQGYTFVTVSDMFKLQGITPVQGFQYSYIPKAWKVNLPDEYYGMYESEKTKTHSTTGTSRSTQSDIIPNDIKYISTNFTAATDAQTFEFTLPDVDAGEYTLYIYSRDASDCATTKLTVNSTDVLGNINFKSAKTDYLPHTQNENGETLKIKVNTKGDVVLVFSAVSTGVLNFDKFVLVSDNVQPSFILGDANDDTKVNAIDLLVIKKEIVNMHPTINRDAADVNKDGKINAIDVLLIKKYITHIITEF